MPARQKLVMREGRRSEEEERVMCGVPDEVLTLSYPSEDIRQKLVGEIVRMDEYFELKLKQLEEEDMKTMR